MSRHQLEVATLNSELGFFFGNSPGAFWGFGLISFDSINRQFYNSKVASVFTTQKRARRGTQCVF